MHDMRGKRPADNQPISVCSGGTLSVGSTSITFTNSGAAAVLITNLNLPGFPPSLNVPGAKNGANGTAIQAISPALAGSYPYTAEPCAGAGTPEIKVQ